MHFVKKVPTTQEEDELRSKERAIKQKIFCAVRDKIFDKSVKNEFDDEMLELTQKLLEKNPDIYTFWIYRRKTISDYVKKRDEMSKKNEYESQQQEYNDLAQKLENIYLNELHLSKTCIEANPKSYSAWFHRGWVLKQQKEPNYLMDLSLCEKALKMDCRNFHVWDHRRIVAKLGNIPSDEELQFSNKLIGDNFSNYSAWHYRVTLLPRVKDEAASISGAYRMDETTLGEELKKVTSAFYTDPDDQSAWVYTRWLLDISSDKEWMLPDSRLPSVPLSVTFNGDKTTLVMSRACTAEVVASFIRANSEGNFIPYSAYSKNPKSSKTWHFTSKTPVKVIGNGFDVSDHDCASGPYINKNAFYIAFGVEARNKNNAIATLTKNCAELIELEPNNVWALAMYNQCLIATDPVANHETIMSNFNKLANELDTKRKQMYIAMACRELLNETLRAKEENGKSLLDNILEGTQKRLVIRNKEITSLDGVELLAGFITELEAPGNCLQSVGDIVLPNLEFLDVNENQIKGIDDSRIFSNLRFLSVAGCPIKETTDVIAALKNMPHLERFLFAETELSQKENCQKLNEELPNCRLIPHWM